MNPARPRVVRTVLQALAQRSGQLTAAEAAALVCQSTSRLRHQFAQAAGMNFRTARLHAKLDRGRLLLKTTASSIPDISAFLGYSDRTKFEKAFKRRYGLTPTQFRFKQVTQRTVPAKQATQGIDKRHTIA